MHRIVLVGYQIRAAAFGYSFLVVGVHLWERQAGAVAFGLLALQFVLYPQLVLLVARRARDGKRVELNAQYLDSFLLGGWTAGLGFPTWIAYAACFSTTLNAAVSRGLAGVARSLVLFALGALAWVVPAGFAYWSATSTLVTTLCFFGSLAYSSAIGCVLYRENKARYGRPTVRF